MSRDGWWWISSRSATYGLHVSKGVVDDAAPIGRRYIGKKWSVLVKGFRRAGTKIERVEPPF